MNIRRPSILQRGCRYNIGNISHQVVHLATRRRIYLINAYIHYSITETISFMGYFIDARIGTYRHLHLSMTLLQLIEVP